MRSPGVPRHLTVLCHTDRAGVEPCLPAGADGTVIPGRGGVAAATVDVDHVVHVDQHRLLHAIPPRGGGDRFSRGGSASSASLGGDDVNQAKLLQDELAPQRKDERADGRPVRVIGRLDGGPPHESQAASLLLTPDVPLACRASSSSCPSVGTDATRATPLSATPAPHLSIHPLSEPKTPVMQAITLICTQMEFFGGSVSVQRSMMQDAGERIGSRRGIRSVRTRGQWCGVGSAPGGRVGERR